MSFQGIIGEIPAGLHGFTAEQNPNRIPAGALIEADGVLIDKGVIRKEPGAAQYGSNGLPVDTESRATTGLLDTLGTVATYRGSSIAFVKTAASNAVNSASAITLTLGAGAVAAGNSIIVCVAVVHPNRGYANYGVGDILSVVDAVGNLYSLDVASKGKRSSYPTSLGLPMRGWIYAAHNVASLANGQTITITFDGTYNSIAAVACEYSGLLDTGALDRTSYALEYGAYYQIRSGFPGALSQPSELLVGGMAANVAPGGSITASNGFTGAGVVATSEYFIRLKRGVRLQQQYRIDTTDPQTIIALHDWHPTASVQRLVTATLDGKLYKDDAGGNIHATTLKSGLSTSARPGRFVEGGKEDSGENRKLFYFNGVNPVQVLDGDDSSTTDLATPTHAPPADWSGTDQPTNGIIHGHQLVGFGNPNDPHRLYFSSDALHTDFTGTGSLQMAVYPSVGERLAAAAHLQGYLYLFKYPRGVFWLDDRDSSTANWAVRQRTDALGCANSPYAALAIDNDVLLLAADASFHLVSAISEGPVTRDSDLSHLLGIATWIREHVNLARLDQVVSVWYPHRKLALFAVPSTGSVNADLMLYFDFSDVAIGGTIKFTWSYRDHADALALRREADEIERPVMGDSGFVYLLDRVDRAKGGLSYAGTYRTPDEDFGALDLRYKTTLKNWHWLELHQNANVDTLGLTGTPHFGGTLDVASEWIAALATYRGSVEVNYVQKLGDGLQTSDPTPPVSDLDIANTGNDTTVGNRVVIVIVYNADTVGGVVSGITDDSSNTYARDYVYVAPTVGTVEIWSAPVTTSLPNADHILVSFSDNHEGVTAHAMEISGLDASPIERTIAGHVLSPGSTPMDSGTAAALSALPQLLVGVAVYDGATSEFTVNEGWFSVHTDNLPGSDLEYYVYVHERNPAVTRVEVYLDKVIRQELEFRQDRPRQRRGLKGSSMEISLRVSNDGVYEDMGTLRHLVGFTDGAD